MAGTIYPTGIDGFTQLPLVQDNISPVRAGDINRLRDAVVAVETELGVNPSGTFGTVKARLDALDDLIADGYGGGGSPGGGGGGDGYVTSSSVPALPTAVAVYSDATGLDIQDTGVTIDGSDNLANLNTLAVNLGTATSTLHVDGSIALGVRTVSSGPTSLDIDDSYIIGDANSGTFVINLPLASSSSGRTYNIKKVDSTTNAITISRSGGDLIDGVTSKSIGIQYEALTLVSDGSAWYLF